MRPTSSTLHWTSSSVWSQRRYAVRFFFCAVVQATSGMRMGSNTSFAQGKHKSGALKMLEDLLVPFLCRRPFWFYPRSRWVGNRPKLVRRRHMGINTQLIGARPHRLFGRRSWISFAEDEEFSKFPSKSLYPSARRGIRLRQCSSVF